MAAAAARARFRGVGGNNSRGATTGTTGKTITTKASAAADADAVDRTKLRGIDSPPSGSRRHWNGPPAPSRTRGGGMAARPPGPASAGGSGTGRISPSPEQRKAANLDLERVSSSPARLLSMPTSAIPAAPPPLCPARRAGGTPRPSLAPVGPPSRTRLAWRSRTGPGGGTDIIIRR